MKVYHGITDFEPIANAIVTSGTFDGVHLGHQKILARLREITTANAGESVVITFWPHPRTVVSSDSSNLKLLSTIDEKIELLAKNGVQHLLIIPFTRQFSELSSEDFIQQILIDAIGTKKLVIGYDHRFGRDREGGFEYLQANSLRYGFGIEEIPRQDVDAMGVSSSKIRLALLEGNLQTATSLLGRAYSLSGTVVKGKQLGRTIGYPTANILPEESYKLVPANGVYAVRVVHRHEVFGGMLNIGTRPTVDGTLRTIEANIFDFERDIYGEHLTVEFVSYIRSEQKFSGLDSLKAQLALDQQTALGLL